jgi:hypothetical protein
VNRLNARLPQGTAAAVLTLAALLAGAPAPAAGAQDAGPKTAQDAQAGPKGDQPRAQSELEKDAVDRLAKMKDKKRADWSAEELVEVVALTYFGGRWRIAAVASAGREEGRITLVTPDGERQGEYTKRFVFGQGTSKDRVRLDLILETAPRPEDHLRYTVAYNGATVWTAQNNTYLQAEPATAAAFKAAVMNDYTALFRYQEDGATVKRLGSKKMVGLDTEVVELTRADGSKVRFYVSPKTNRVLHVEYDLQLAAGQSAVTFRESYFDWKVIQNTVVPGVRKLRMSDQLVQTLTLGTATFGGAVDDQVFLQL